MLNKAKIHIYLHARENFDTISLTTIYGKCKKMINLDALFSDETIDYKTPYQPEPGDEVKVSIRTLKNNVKHVLVYVNDQPLFVPKVRSDESFDYYEKAFKCSDKKVNYYFSVSDGEETVYYNRIGAVKQRQAKHDFSFVPGFKIPEWALGTVYYQIFTDRFRNGNTANDVADNEYYYINRQVKHIDDWNRSPASYDVANFYGGDLQGVMEKLDYLKDLGVDTIYFNPIFVSPSNHKYDTQDYDHIDPHFAIIEEDTDCEMKEGNSRNSEAYKYIKRVTSAVNLKKSNEYFAELVKEIHKRDMHVVIDGVFNHCGSFNKWMDKEDIYRDQDNFEVGAYESVNSPYRNYFKFNSNKKNSKYEGWWGLDTLPKLNYEGSKELVDYIIKTGRKWVSEPYNIDGWRIDVAADLGHSPEFNHNFWKLFRKNVREANPEAVILAEHYGSPEAWLNGYEWDTVMNYDAFMEPVTWFITGMEKHSDSFDGHKYLDGKLFFASMFENMSVFSRPSLDSAMNQLSNHDHSRFLTRTNHKAGRLASLGAEAAIEGINVQDMKLAVLMQMTWPGAPALYYGDEAGQVGWTDPDNRRTYPWGNENKELLEFHKEAIALHRNIGCLKMGSIKPLAMGKGYVAYARFNREECAIVVINAGDHGTHIEIPVWECGMPKDGKLKYIHATNEKTNAEIILLENGMLKVFVHAHCGRVYTGKITEDR